MKRITDPHCGKSWSGLKAEHCPKCHETFTSTSAADAAHRTLSNGRLECRPIAEVKRRDRKDQPPYGLKWNASQQAWGWDKPKTPRIRVHSSSQSAEGVGVGTKDQGAKSDLQSGAVVA